MRSGQAASHLTIRGSAFKFKLATELHSTTAGLSDQPTHVPLLLEVLYSSMRTITVLTVRV